MNTDTINYRMFEAVARKALRAGIRDEGRQIGLSDLDEEATSLAYALARRPRVALRGRRDVRRHS